MGMKKISSRDELEIVRIIRQWHPSQSLTWELLRETIASSKELGVDEVWSRQSLSNNDSIKIAYQEAKKRLAENRNGHKDTPVAPSQYAMQIQQLQAELQEVKTKYETLLLRHTQLAYNVSQVDGVNHLLADPLPDNTRSQKG